MTIKEKARIKRVITQIYKEYANENDRFLQLDGRAYQLQHSIGRGSLYRFYRDIGIGIDFVFKSLTDHD